MNLRHPFARPGQFAVVHENGLTHIERQHDAAFRKALIDGCPDQVRPKMREALAVIPQPGAAAHSQRYFGPELPAILVRSAPLIDEIDLLLLKSFNLPGFKDWLVLTGFGNDYRMIKAMVAWADLIYARESAEKAEAARQATLH